MANPFLEERLPINVRMGATYGDGFQVEITQTRDGSEYRRLLSPFPRREISVQYVSKADEMWSRVVSLYFRAYGMFAGFRVRNMDDFSTNSNTGTPTAFDSPMALVSAGVYQLQKQYGQGGAGLAIGLPVRTLFKPVSGTVKVGISGLEIPAQNWSCNTTSGVVSFNANKTANITGVTKGITTTIACAGHSFVAGEAVYIAGCGGMTQINGLRALITSVVAGVSITVAINSSGFTAYTSSGALNSRPQTGEPVTCGCEFDLPCRFNSRIDISHASFNVRESGAIDIIELVTP